MRKLLFGAAVTGLLLSGASAASAECIQWPNPFGWDMAEVCHELPVELEDLLKVEG